jgi:hypothetical protein
MFVWIVEMVRIVKFVWMVPVKSKINFTAEIAEIAEIKNQVFLLLYFLY